jgi:putative ABC transport system permease protein
LLSEILIETRHAVRRLRHDPAIALAAAVTLALGVGATVVMADMLDRLLIRPPSHVTAADRVARFYLPIGPAFHFSATSYPVFQRLSSSVGAELEYAAAYLKEELTLGRGPEAERVHVVAHSRAYFDVLGISAERGVLPGMRGASGPDVAVISHALWQRRFGGADDVLGRPIALAMGIFTIVGVTPRGFAGIDTDSTDVWLPLESRADDTLGSDWRTQPFSLAFQMIGRLRQGAHRPFVEERATAGYAAGQDQPWMRQGRVVLGELSPARAPGGPPEIRVAVWVTAVSVLVLLIACGNVASLLLVKGLRRTREFAVKIALGATRARLLREILLEAALLAMLSGTVALVLVVMVGAPIRRLFLSPVAAFASPLDLRLVMLTVAVCVVAAFILGTVPALHLTSRRSVDPGAPSRTTQPSRLLDGFIGVQVALSVPLIVGAGLFALSLWQARHQALGLDPEHMAVVLTNLFELGQPWKNHAVHRRIQERLAALPQVQAVALTEQVPMLSFMGFNITVPGPDPVQAMAAPYVNAVDPAFFQTAGVRLIAGRGLNASDNRVNAQPVAIVNETMARRFWLGESAVGKCFHMGPRDTPCVEVVGVSGDVRLTADVKSRTEPAFVVAIERYPKLSSGRALLVRTTVNPRDALALLRQEVQAVGQDLPYVEVFAFEDVLLPMLRPWRLGSTVFVAFGFVSLIIACIGLSVVTSYGVTRRLRELGIRMALGAGPQRLTRLVLRRTIVALAAGLAVGVILALIGGRWLGALLFGISARDLRVFALTAVLLSIVGTIAAWLPARRAGHVDPAAALRAE